MNMAEKQIIYAEKRLEISTVKSNGKLKWWMEIEDNSCGGVTKMTLYNYAWVEELNKWIRRKVFQWKTETNNPEMQE